MIERARKRLSKRAKKGFRGWPLATVALYGPDDTTATKLTVGIVPGEDAEATDLRRWLSKDQTDIRDDIRATEEVLAFITEAGAKSVVMADRIIGCPHEEGRANNVGCASFITSEGFRLPVRASLFGA